MHLYGWDEDVASNAVDVHVHQLRRKLEPDVIRTVRGIGYALGDIAEIACESLRSALLGLLLATLSCVMLIAEPSVTTPACRKPERFSMHGWYQSTMCW
jgi:hypothetical protein